MAEAFGAGIFDFATPDWMQRKAHASAESSADG
jgi:hypothetical protein